MDIRKFVPLAKPLPIRDQEWPENIVPFVSVCCTTFNHARYIHDCLQGFLMQETRYPVEILVHDDASTDGTADIIREYTEAFPQLIKPILQTENQLSQRKPTSANNYGRARGDYVAICEGDDYWIDPLKLEKQASALEKNPDIDLSIHSAYKIDYRTGAKTLIGLYMEKSGIVSVGSVITKSHGMIPTASSFVRRSVFSELFEFRKSRSYLMVGDIYLHFFGARRGGAFYFHEPMSVYRAQLPGSWNQRIFMDPRGRMKHESARLKSYYELDKLTGYRYSAYFMEGNNSRAGKIIQSKKISFSRKAKFYFSNFRYIRVPDALRHGVVALTSSLLSSIKRTRDRFIGT